jgi:hypothetical protein
LERSIVPGEGTTTLSVFAPGEVFGIPLAIDLHSYRLRAGCELIQIKDIRDRTRSQAESNPWEIAMFGWRSHASLILALGLLASPALAQQAAQPEHHPGGGMMGHAMPSGAMMGAGGGAMMGASGGGMMGASGMPMMGMMHMMMGEDGIRGMGMMGIMAGHVEGRLAFLKTELKITDAQLPQWDKFAEAVRENAKAITRVVQGDATGASQSAGLPDKLAAREKLLSTQLAAVQKLKAAVGPLYAALSDPQKKTADELAGSMGMMM